MRAAIAQWGAFSLLLLAVGCVRVPPDADGRTLGEIHVQLLEADKLTVDQWVEDLETARRRHETPDARRAFDKAYNDTIAPSRDKLAALVVKDAGQRAGEALKDMGQRLGEGFRDLLRDIGESARELRGEKGEFEESLRNLGRELGKTIKEVSDGVEAIADGVNDGLDKKE